MMNNQLVNGFPKQSCEAQLSGKLVPFVLDVQGGPKLIRREQRVTLCQASSSVK